MSLQGRKSQFLLQYKLATDTFVMTEEFVDNGNGTKSTYVKTRRFTSPEFKVEAQPDYPEIPTSRWTLALEVDQQKHTVKSTLTNVDFTASPHGVLVQYSVSSSATAYTIWLPPAGAEPAEYLHVDSAWPFVGELLCDANTSGDRYYGAHQTHRPNRTVYLTLAFQINRGPTDLMPILDAGQFTDCTLISSDGRTFSAHRAILAAVSPIFMELFEKQGDHPPSHFLIDLTGELLETLLQYVYDRMPMKLAGRLEEFWAVAEQFEMTALQCACEDMMMADVGRENAMKYFDFARERGLEHLQRKAATCIASDQ
ncbi:TD and POZ domain-containing protein 4-like [Paramacrobiotus metropolitanus]|uniref:TD and POZ domain-containing protein 4-like n=1 Tax=Paramacrobiotus metropolitanus TaxID=2943436 RepID=UPI002445B643|nr:TD and POZ domain-containing protein 4-like [Paramacrobiotus metropolitanus]